MRRSKRWLPISALCFFATFGQLYAQESSVDNARILFDAGAKAYAAGLYDDAVTAFREAHALAPDRPTVLFSLAQAERRQYTVSLEPAMLEAAISHFRKYLEIVAEGGRRTDAVVALAELETLRAGLETRAETPVKKARIFVTTETPSAVIFVDGVKRDKVPVIEEVAPGKHVVKFDAPGFIAESREIVAVEGTIFPLEVNLREKPSFLSITAPAGASITVDGRTYGDAPLHAPLELASGPHQLLVTQRGYISHEAQVSVLRDATSSASVTLKPTVQRRVSYVLVGTTVAGLGIGAGLVIGAIAKDREASDLFALTKSGNISGQTLEQYMLAREARNVLTGTSVAVMLIAAGVGAAAAFTYSFDSSSRSTGGPVRKEARISATPLPGGGIVSVGLGF